MTETESTPANGYSKLLLWGGWALVAAGAIIGFAAKGAAEREANIDEYTASFSGYLIDVEPNYAGAWAGAFVAVLGIVMLLIFVAKRAR